MLHRILSTICIVFLCLFLSSLKAQINLKTGYNFSIVQADGFNDLITAQNNASNYSSPFSKLTWLHGLEAGLRFKYDAHAFELTYQGAYQSLNAEGNEQDMAFTDKMKISIHGLGVGYQVSEGWFGAGADLQYQFYRTKFTKGVDESVLRDVQKMYGLKLYLMFTLQGGNSIDMALQPYYILPFKEYNVSNLKDDLNLTFNTTNDKWRRFGITVLFYNGGK